MGLNELPKAKRGVARGLKTTIAVPCFRVK